MLIIYASINYYLFIFLLLMVLFMTMALWDLCFPKSTLSLSHWLFTWHASRQLMDSHEIFGWVNKLIWLGLTFVNKLLSWFCDHEIFSLINQSTIQSINKPTKRIDWCSWKFNRCIFISLIYVSYIILFTSERDAVFNS